MEIGRSLLILKKLIYNTLGNFHQMSKLEIYTIEVRLGGISDWC
ncbi:MAG: hypothetical protein FD155_761 [Bacteroidetes bacterium]|nr:MAG: hypothetical protein FD155_761 [Bacteroidota bacterium]